MGLFDKIKKTKDEEAVSEKETVVGEVQGEKEQKTAPKRAKAKKSETSEKSETGEAVKSNKSTKVNDTLIHAVVSEKCATGESMGVYTFVVKSQANKIEIKKAIKDMYDVVPSKVRVINVEGKDTRFGNKQGKRSDWKKAIVTLPKGKTINIHEGV